MLNQNQYNINKLIFESNAHDNTEYSPISQVQNHHSQTRKIIMQDEDNGKQNVYTLSKGQA